MSCGNRENESHAGLARGLLGGFGDMEDLLTADSALPLLRMKHPPASGRAKQEVSLPSGPLRALICINTDSLLEKLTKEPL